MKTALQDFIRELQRPALAKVTGAVKTYPSRELLKISTVLQNELRRKELSSEQTQQFQSAYERVQKIITKRIEAVQQLIANFAALPPEAIALKNSVFALVRSRDLLEDLRAAFEKSPPQLHELNRASANILEAVNIEIQQRFYKLAPETIAIHHSGESLMAYRELLQNLLAHLDRHSDIFEVYQTIIKTVAAGSAISQAQISPAKALCAKVFQASPPAYDAVLNQATAEESEAAAKTLRAALEMLERDITNRPSVVELTNQCRQLLQAIPEHAVDRKTHMRKTSRALQLSHYIEFLTIERISENATHSLMLCQKLFEDARRFLVEQQSHLDVALNLKSLEDAHQKVEDGMRYRQYALAQLFKDISGLSAKELALVPEKRLGETTLLLQEIWHLLEDYLHRSPAMQLNYVVKIAAAFRENIRKLHEAILVSKSSPGITYQPLEFEQTLPHLSKFYDEELLGLIRKALKPGNAAVEPDANPPIENAYVIPIERLHQYIEAFIRIVNARTKTDRFAEF